jgi:hypothetical protein
MSNANFRLKILKIKSQDKRIIKVASVVFSVIAIQIKKDSASSLSTVSS